MNTEKESDEILVDKSIEEISKIYELHISKTNLEGEISNIKKASSNVSSSDVASDLSSDIPMQDVLIITAMTDEYDELMRVLPDPYLDTIKNGLAVSLVNLPTTTHHVLSLACVNIDGMGPVKTAVVTTKALMTFRPRLSVLIGICATGQHDVSLGDIVVAERAYDYDSGKLENGKFAAAFEPIELLPKVRAMLSQYCRSKKLAERVHAGFVYGEGKPRQLPKIHIGTFASGSKVLADQDYVATMKEHQRKIHGIEMEVYSFYRACWETVANQNAFFAVKAVQDKANVEKSDQYRQYCSYASAYFVKCFIEAKGTTIWAP